MVYLYKNKIENPAIIIGPIKTLCGEYVTVYIKKENNIVIDIGYATEGSHLVHIILEQLCKMIKEQQYKNSAEIKDIFQRNFILRLIGTRKESVDLLINAIVEQL